MAVVVTELPEVGVTVLSSWIFNCYVVDRAPERALIVDPGTPRLAAAALARLDPGRAREALVVATHGHVDHVGGLDRLVAAGLEAALPARIEQFLAGATPQSPSLGQIMSISPVLAEQPFTLRPLLEIARSAGRVGYGPRGIHFPPGPHQWLHDGARLEGAEGWTVLHTPGHTDDSTALWHAATGVLISGDAVLSLRGRPWFTPEIADGAEAARSEARLRELPVRVLLPGHGRHVVGEALMERALAPTQR